MAARLESATKTTGYPILLGSGFAKYHEKGLLEVGEVELAGFAKPVKVYVPEGFDRIGCFAENAEAGGPSTSPPASNNSG
jgi:hypothetical protein